MIAEQETTQKQDRGRRVWLPGFFALAMVILFLPCWSAPTLITHDESILRLPLLSTWRNLPIVFSQSFMMFSDGIYRPISYGLVAVLRTFVPVEAAWFWRTILIALHGLNAWLVFIILRHFIKSTAPAVLGLAVFALHPLASVVANNINHLHLLMGATFTLAVLASFLLYRDGRGPRWLGLALLFFILGLLTSRVVITLPLLLVVYDLVYEKRRLGKKTVCLLPFVVLVPMAIGLWIHLGPHPVLYTYRASSGGEWPSFLSIIADSHYYVWGLLFGKNIPVVLHDVVRRLFGRQDPHFASFLRWATFHISVVFLSIAFGARRESGEADKDVLVVLQNAAMKLPLWRDNILTRIAAHAVVFLLDGLQALTGRTIGLGLVVIYTGMLPFLTTAFNPVNDYVSWTYLYVPLLGLAIIVGALTEQTLPLGRAWPRRVSFAALLLLVVFYAGQLLRLNWATRSPIAYWTLVVDKDPEGQTAQVELGKAYLAKGDVARAMEHLFNPATLELQEPCRVMCHNYLARGDTFAAAMHAGFMNNPMTKASLFTAIGAFDHAESHLGRALASNPFNTRAMKLLARIFARKGFVEDAGRWLNHVLAIDSTDAEARQALYALREGDLDAHEPETPSADWLRFIAMGQATKRVRHEIIEKSKDYPDDPVVQMRAGHCLMENGDVTLAMSTFQKIYPRLPSYAPLASMVSWALSSAEKPDATIDRHGRPPHQRPAEAMYHYNLGAELAKQGKLDEAMTQFSAALKIDPKDPLTHYQLGLVLSRKNMLDEATWHYTEALRLDPYYTEAMTNLGNVLSDQGKVDEAIDHFKRSLKIKPDDANIHYNLAVAYFQKGDYAAAWKHLEEAQHLGKKVRPDFVKELRAKARSVEP